MGLVFPLQPDLKNSQMSQHLVIRTTKSRFSMGFGFLVGGCLLGTMFLAASPLFKLFWEEGQLFDRILTAVIVGLIFLYPSAAIVSWFFEDVVEVSYDPNSDSYDVKKFSQVLGFKFFKKELKNQNWMDLSIVNYKDGLNMAAIAQTKTGVQDRYSTKGHWILAWQTTPLEKRAKRDDILELYLQMSAFFKKEPQKALI
jgi:hypothetical protein